VQILGGVVDVEFPPGQLPEIFEGDRGAAREQPANGSGSAEAFGETTGCGRWRWTPPMVCSAAVPAFSTGNSISVPVGAETLGRVFNVLGRPVDGKGPVDAKQYYPIHRLAPPFSEQTTRVEAFETVLESESTLVAPFTKGGNTGIFGGAGVGKPSLLWS